MNARVFKSAKATQGKAQLLVALIGPSGTGKTFSALRLATGIERETKGKIFLIDTENERALHYAPRDGDAASLKNGTFDFTHVSFGAPFSSLDYLAAIEHCVSEGASTIIIDSVSHEHEGPGGVLEFHDEETGRLSKEWGQPRSKVQMAAWSEPKKQRRRLINSILQAPVNLILCFRAKEKIKLVKGAKEPVALGWQPIGGEEFPYECTTRILLKPGANGVPCWKAEEESERDTMKLPRQFTELFRKPEQLSEEHGAAMALWASGGGKSALPQATEANLTQAIAVLEIAPSIETLRATAADLKRGQSWSEAQSKAIKTAMDKRVAELKANKSEQAEDREPGSDDE